MQPKIYLGPPGCGKTRTLLEQADTLLAGGMRPDRLGFVSFTKQAANEAIGRATKKFNIERDGLPYFRTLHSLCYQQLRLKSDDVVTPARLQEFARFTGVIEISPRFSLEEGTIADYSPGDRIMFMEGLARMRGIPLHQQWKELFTDNLNWPLVIKVATDYAQFKRCNGLVDYTDMLSQFLAEGQAPKLDALLVDESQDLSQIQWRVVEKLAENIDYLAIAGDDDQALFRWAGADVDHFLNLEGDTQVLGQSWRVPPAVQSVALDVLRRLSRRREKPWAPRQGEGSVVRRPDLLHTDFDGDDVLVLARNSYIIRKQIIPELRRRGIIYEHHGHSSIRPSILGAVYDWEALRKGREITAQAVRGVYEFMTAGRGVRRGFKQLADFPNDSEMVGLDVLRKRGGLQVDGPWFEALDRIPESDGDYLRTALRHGERPGRPRVRLSTIHSAKGGEAKHVVLFKEMAWRTDEEMRRTRAGRDDEARVWYVAVTRAIEQLSIVEPSMSAKAWCMWI